MKRNSSPEYLTLKELADFFRLSPGYVYRKWPDWTTRGLKFKKVSTGGKILFDRQSAEDLLNAAK